MRGKEQQRLTELLWWIASIKALKLDKNARSRVRRRVLLLRYVDGIVHLLANHGVHAFVHAFHVAEECIEVVLIED